jgi:hypothetical protein
MLLPSTGVIESSCGLSRHCVDMGLEDSLPRSSRGLASSLACSSHYGMCAARQAGKQAGRQFHVTHHLLSMMNTLSMSSALPSSWQGVTASSLGYSTTQRAGSKAGRFSILCAAWGTHRSSQWSRPTAACAHTCSTLRLHALCWLQHVQLATSAAVLGHAIPGVGPPARHWKARTCSQSLTSITGSIRGPSGNWL